MKITTWNVNGYRAILKKGFSQWIFANDAEIVCLQEVKARPEQVSPDGLRFNGYQAAWNPAERPGYSGVMSFYRNEPLEIRYNLQDERFDPEGRVIWMKYPEFTLLNVYFPSGQRGQERVGYKLAFYEKLLSQLAAAHSQGEKLIVCGDFNTAHQEIDLANPKQNNKTSGFLPEEREWVGRYLNAGFRDVFRDLYPERRQYTWWSLPTGARQRNVGWRLDYFLISDSLMSCVKDTIIHDEITGSDHCPVSLILE